MILLTPLIICNAVEAVASQIAIIFLSTDVFLTALTALIKTRSMKLFLIETT